MVSKRFNGNCQVKIFTGLYFTGFNTQILGHLIRSSFYIQFENLPQRSGQNILLEELYFKVNTAKSRGFFVVFSFQIPNECQFKAKYKAPF